jgi:phosphoribosyl-ATP pyrophosphohydrolase/phosphoribosyl-AMP cyclohydrolase
MHARFEELDFDKMGGLLPAVVQHFDTGQVLMLGYMNTEALDRTLQSGRVTFWSRSRNELWTKGDTSGNRLTLKEIRIDCDRDALLVLAQPTGPVCHRGELSCFGREREWSGLEFLPYLEDLIQQRQSLRPEESYTTRLFAKGLDEIVKKLGEEAVEVVVSAGQDRQRSVEESADLLYHLLVFLTARELKLRQVIQELERRHGTSH